jgi:cell division protein ZipA
MQNFNITVLAVVLAMVAIIWLYSRKKRAVLQKKQHEFSSPSLGGVFDTSHEAAEDEGIIAVRKKDYLSNSQQQQEFAGSELENAEHDNISDDLYADSKEDLEIVPSIDRRENTYPTENNSPILLLHVMAKKKAIFSGYELLQVLLAVGLRFGNMNIFHYYREISDGQEEVLFSLASATEPGVFDIRNMSAFSCLGLTLFMKKTGDETVDKARYDLMLQTASHLTEDLDGVLLDAKKDLLFQPKTALSLEQ